MTASSSVDVATSEWFRIALELHSRPQGGVSVLLDAASRKICGRDILRSKENLTGEGRPSGDYLEPFGGASSMQDRPAVHSNVRASIQSCGESGEVKYDAMAGNAVAVDRLPVVQVLAWTWLMGSSQGAVAESFLIDRTAGA